MSPGDLGVLVVDDEDGVRRFLDRAMQMQGFAPVVRSNGEDALRTAAAMPRLDLLITDMLMPDMNGDEVARRLRAMHPDLKVLYLTGFSDRLFAEKSALWEDEAFLDKPCSVTGLKEAIALLVTGRIDPMPTAQQSEMRV
jgi:two-component system cell cycle sensor histidine kinase/response regulator CckA